MTRNASSAPQRRSPTSRSSGVVRAGERVAEIAIPMRALESVAHVVLCDLGGLTVLVQLVKHSHDHRTARQLRNGKIATGSTAEASYRRETSITTPISHWFVKLTENRWKCRQLVERWSYHQTRQSCQVHTDMVRR